MPIELSAVVVRHERRLRVLFSAPVAAGAFRASSYVLSGASQTTRAPVPVGALVVPGAPHAVELALDADLAANELYAVRADNVPAVDGSVSSPGVRLDFRLADGPAIENDERPAGDIGALLYGVDLVWRDGDFVETPLGDLAVVAGLDNVRGALSRRLSAEEDLPWRPGSYGLGARDYVDGPQQDATTLRGAILRQSAADDRVKRAKATFSFDKDGEGDAFFDVELELRGTEAVRLTVSVPTPSRS